MISYVGPYLKMLVVPVAMVMAAAVTYFTGGEEAEIDALGTSIATILTMILVWAVPNIQSDG